MPNVFEERDPSLRRLFEECGARVATRNGV